MSKPKPKEGFRVGQYFCTFPEGEFVKEDKDGNLYVLVDIFKINKDDSAEKIEPSELLPEVQEQIHEAINTMLLEALEAEKKASDIDVKD